MRLLKNKKADEGFQSSLLLLGKLVIAAIMIMLLFSIAYMLFQFITGEDPDETTARSMFYNLGGKIHHTLKNPSKMVVEPDSPMKLPEDFVLVAFDSGLSEQKSITVPGEKGTLTLGRTKNLKLEVTLKKPLSCGESACLCLYRDFDTGSWLEDLLGLPFGTSIMTLEEDQLTDPCIAFPGKIIFRSVTHVKPEDASKTMSPRSPAPYKLGSGSYTFPERSIYHGDEATFRSILNFGLHENLGYTAGTFWGMPVADFIVTSLGGWDDTNIYMDKWAFAEPTIIVLSPANEYTKARAAEIGKVISDLGQCKLDDANYVSGTCKCAGQLKPPDMYCCPESAPPTSPVQERLCTCAPAGSLSSCTDYMTPELCDDDPCKQKTKYTYSCEWDQARECCYSDITYSGGQTTRVYGLGCKD